MFSTRQAPANGTSRDSALDELAPFRVSHAGELLAYLKQLRDGAVPVVLGAPEGAALTALLWSVDVAQRRLNFSVEAAHPLLDQLVNTNEAVAVAYLDSVKVQFDLAELMLVHGGKQCMLQARMPGELFRFQRRSAFRVRTLERTAPTATLRHPAIPDMRLGLRVLDISIGGCALQLPADVPAIEPGVQIQGVQLELDAETRFVTALQVHHISALGGEGAGLRAGCEWLRLDREAERLLQRCIDQTQKRRRLLAMN